MKKTNKDSIFKAVLLSDVKIDIALNGSDPNLLAVKCNANPYVSKMNDSTYLVRFMQKVDETKVKLYYKNLPVSIKTFSVTDLPLPSCIIDGSSSEIRKSYSGKEHKFELKWPENYELDFNSLKLYNARIQLAEGNSSKSQPLVGQLDLSKQIYNYITSSVNSGATISITDISFVNSYGNVMNVVGNWNFKVLD